MRGNASDLLDRSVMERLARTNLRLDYPLSYWQRLIYRRGSGYVSFH